MRESSSWLRGNGYVKLGRQKRGHGQEPNVCSQILVFPSASVNQPALEMVGVVVRDTSHVYSFGL